MNIKGKFQDVLREGDEVIADTGWESNDIVKEYGVFLASLMKKRFASKIGIDYIAVGRGSGDATSFKTRVGDFFKNGERLIEHYEPGHDEPTYWVWAKEIDPENNITYLGNNGDTSTYPTNTLRIRIQFMENEPAQKTFDFEEFALLGIDKAATGLDKPMYFIDYVKHRKIIKDANMKLTRTIILTYLE